MMLALGFDSPWLLLGLLAAAIPFVLHMLSSVKAQEVLFPTLRFLKSSMERTARRRKIQHWLLLLMRAALLGLLAVAVAEPISKASQGWMGQEDYAAVVVLDNSYSMQARGENGTRFAQARNEVMSMLDGDHKPVQAALLSTNGTVSSQSLTSQLEDVRTDLQKVQISYGRAPVAGRVREAIALLQEQQNAPQKSIYLFSDLQRSSFEELLQLDSLAAAKDIHLFIINTAHRPPDNVGISNLEISGNRVVDQSLAFTATLVNSSPVGKKVQVALRIGGQQVGSMASVSLAPAGQTGSSTTTKFYHIFPKAGFVTGDVVVATEDDLPQDNIRSFSIQIGQRVKALVVRGPVGADAGLGTDPIRSLRLALEPWSGSSHPWSIVAETVEAEQFRADSLRGAAIAFFCEVPTFTPQQAKALIDFTAAGGTSVFFLGPRTIVDDYNKLFVDDLVKQGGLLPARIGPAVGEVGPAADATPVDWVDMDSGCLKGIYGNMSDYLIILIQRYYKLTKPSESAKAMMRLRGGMPLMLSKPFGSGTAVLCATTASPRWGNLPVGGANVFLSMLEKMSLAAAPQSKASAMYLPDAQVTIGPGTLADEGGSHAAELPIEVTVPKEDQKVESAVVNAKWNAPDGYRAIFTKTAMPGLYHWQASQGGVKAKSEGWFAVNPVGSESDLDAITPANLQAALTRKGMEHVYVAGTLAEANAQAVTVAKGRRWWDLVIAIVIVLLVTEAVVANRKKADPDAAPAHQQN